MPLLVNVLRADVGAENKLLKAKCIECSTLIALAVGKEKFAPHSQELIQLFGHIQQSATEDDDLVKLYLEQAWGRICKIFRERLFALFAICFASLDVDSKGLTRYFIIRRGRCRGIETQ